MPHRIGGTFLRRSRVKQTMIVTMPSLEALRGDAARYARPRTAKEAAIVDAATRLFGEKGYEATRTADVAAAAGVTERTLFRYFPSKESLYRRGVFPALPSGAAAPAPPHTPG